MAIPRIIHQLWKDKAVPGRYKPFRETWARLHPGWEMQLWTDGDLVALIERDYPGLLEIYHGYRHRICGADLGRYLVLHRFGGVYADLDCECLKPVGPLIEGAGFVIGLEPDAHIADPRVAGFSRLLCPSFIAAEPGHDFWNPVFERIVDARHSDDPLEATGPFLLTRAYDSHPRRASIRLATAEQLYPIAKADCWNGRVHDLEFWEAATHQAYVLHYWDGGWFRPEVWAGGLPGEIPAAINEPSAPRAGFDHGQAKPKISGLMISRGTLEPALLGIEAFLGQTYPDKELLIIARTPEAGLADHVRALDRADVRLVRAEPTASQGELRNLGLSLAKGALICRWEEDDLHDPRRLDIQYEVLKQTDAHACLMRRWVAWRPAASRLGVVDARPLAASLLCLKSAMPSYPIAFDDGSDPAVETLLAQARVTLFDLARLSVHLGAATDADEMLATAFEGERCDAVLTELAKRLPIEARSRLRGVRPPGSDVDVRLFGHFSSTTGIGASSRGAAAALAAAGVRFTVVDVPWPEEHPEPIPIPPPRDARVTDDAIWPVNLIHMNPGDMAFAMRQSPASFSLRDWERAFTVGLWAWETANGAPPSWRTFHPTYDEVWTPSAHAAAAIARSAPVPVVVIPHAIAPPAPTLDRAALGLPADAFVFLFAFDPLSNVQRKNPAGLIAAYLIAFPTPSPAVMLVVKTRALSAADAQRLFALKGERTDIRIIVEPWSSDRLFSLMAACDCYVSLHRAEGFGLTMAEAMYYGKPVIATAYSGNMDFMSPETAYLVPYQLTTLEAADGDYPAGSVWADPDVEAAAALMAHVAANRAEAAVVGERASRWVRAHLSAEAIGQQMKDRLARPRAGKERRVATPRGRPPNPEPDVLILTPVKDARVHLPRYVELIRRLDYDPARLSLAFLESDSRDGTAEALAEVSPALPGLARVELHTFDFGFHIEGPRWAAAIQRRRREIIARSRNRLVNAALRDEAWVLWLDADLADYPPDLLRRLLAAEKDVVVPHCVTPDGATFDLNTFRFSPESGGRDDPRHLVDGLFQPPRGEGRLYLDAFPRQDIVHVDSVGGAGLLVRADLHREGLSFPPFSYRGYIETEGLAMIARDMGHDCWGLPQLRIVHS
jgi:glycosyltransferase involved in cell wall biosynthesis